MFADLLRPVLRNFIPTFNEEQSDSTRDLSYKTVHRSGGGSEPSYFGGWLTAFYFWDNVASRCMSLVSVLSNTLATTQSCWM
jgi:hypothetical protein